MGRAALLPCGGVERHEPAQARAEERHRAFREGVERTLQLQEHPAHGERLEIGLIEIRGVQAEPEWRQAFAQERGLSRLGRRGEAVQVKDVHYSLVLQAGRH